MSRLAYTIDQLEEASGVSRSVIYRHIRDGNLVPRYPSSRPIFPAAEADAWIESLTTLSPAEQRKAAARSA